MYAFFCQAVHFRLRECWNGHVQMPFSVTGLAPAGWQRSERWLGRTLRTVDDARTPHAKMCQHQCKDSVIALGLLCRRVVVPRLLISSSHSRAAEHHKVPGLEQPSPRVSGDPWQFSK